MISECFQRDRWYFILNIGGSIDEYMRGMSQGYERERGSIREVIHEQNGVIHEQNGLNVE